MLRGARQNILLRQRNEVSSPECQMLKGDMSKDETLKGLGGWLILVGAGVVLTPVRLVILNIATFQPLFEEGAWEALTTVGSVAYHPLWAPIIIGEIVFNSAMLAASLWLVYLFFSKHHFFPKAYIGLVAISLVFVPLDAWIVAMVLPNESIFDPVATKEFVRVLVPTLIWVPYMLLSKRVKLTFVEKMPVR